MTFTKERLVALSNRENVGAICAEEIVELARRALASLRAEPVAIVEPSDYVTAAQLVGECPARKAVHELYEGALRIGDKLYRHAPPAPVSVPNDVMAAMQKVARIRLDLNDFDGDKRGILDCLGDAEEALIEVVNRRAAMLQGAEPTNQRDELPMQPLVMDAHGTLRFKENPIVRKLLDYAAERGYGLNEIARAQFDAEDQMQLAQLIGYSLSGYGTLSYVTDKSYDRAAATAPQQEDPQIKK